MAHLKKLTQCRVAFSFYGNEVVSQVMSCDAWGAIFIKLPRKLTSAGKVSRK